ncbi:hypothetical protein HX072_24750, partial [Escherichia coli]|uniref:reverse transcriptase domain-containing protein n=1 Tax=Escherichia coli TaxID=562 RepID=UPI002578A27F
EDVYVTQPPGFELKGHVDKVMKLKKALYGLKQAPRAWNVKLDRSLANLGFSRCPLEYAVYKRVRNGSLILVGVYVDDLIITGSNLEGISEFKIQMQNCFRMSDLGLLSYYLGIEVHQSKAGICLNQSNYARKILKELGMDECNASETPMEERLKLSKKSKGKPLDTTMYRGIVGSLRYLTHTRQDLSFTVGIVSRFIEAPTIEHLTVIKRILRYIKGTLNYGLMFAKSEKFE